VGWLWSETLFKKRAFCLTVWLVLLPFAATANPPAPTVNPLAEALAAPASSCDVLRPAPVGAALERLEAFYRGRDYQLAWRDYRQIDHLLETGANDVMVVKPCAESLDDRERLLPYTDQCVLKIDLVAGEMQVDWDADF